METVAEIDIFHLYRWSLAVVVAVYTVVCTWRTVSQWLLYMREDRRAAILGRYTLTLLLRMKWHRFAGELIQIGVLLGVLASLVGLHAWHR